MTPNFEGRALGPVGGGRARLVCEQLHERIVPSAPQITDFAAAEVSAGVYMFTGRVADNDDVTGLWVGFDGGPASVQGMKAEVQSDGSFCLVVNVQTDGSDSGTVVATVTDWDDLTSDPVYVGISP